MSTDTPKPSTSHLTSGDAERDAAAAAWAEHEMTLPANSSTALRADAAADHGRAALEAALGGPEEVERSVRGRKTLGTDRPAGRSPKRQVSVPVDLDARAAAYIEAGGARDYATLMRAALEEYLTRHRLPA